MGDVENKECIVCGHDSVLKYFNQPDEKSQLLKIWSAECAKTVCEILLGDENLPTFLQYFVDYQFCSKCDETVRDIHYFVNQIEAFKKRIEALTELIRSRLLFNFGGNSKNEENELVKTRISKLIAKGPKGLKLYTNKEIAEIIYAMTSNERSKTAERNSLVEPSTETHERSSKMFYGGTNDDEVGWELVSEFNEHCENLMEDHDHNVDDDNFDADFSDRSHTPEETNMKLDFAKGVSVSYTPKFPAKKGKAKKGRRCILPFCSSAVNSTPGVSFHEFPVYMPVRELWLKNISKRILGQPSKTWIPGENAKVCSLHFTEKDFRQGFKRKLLKPNAVPFCPSASSKKAVRAPYKYFNPHTKKYVISYSSGESIKSTDGVIAKSKSKSCRNKKVVNPTISNASDLIMKMNDPIDEIRKSNAWDETEGMQD